MVHVEEVREDFRPLEGLVAGVYLWGSHAEGGATPRSDIDVCIVAGPGVGIWDALAAAWTRARLGDRPYDIKVFEELPLFLKAAVLERGVLLLARDPVSLSEYLRPWARLWADQAHRNRMGEDDARRLLAARRARLGRA